MEHSPTPHSQHNHPTLSFPSPCSFFNGILASHWNTAPSTDFSKRFLFTIPLNLSMLLPSNFHPLLKNLKHRMQQRNELSAFKIFYFLCSVSKYACMPHICECPRKARDGIKFPGAGSRWFSEGGQETKLSPLE